MNTCAVPTAVWLVLLATDGAEALGCGGRFRDLRENGFGDADLSIQDDAESPVSLDDGGVGQASLGAGGPCGSYRSGSPQCDDCLGASQCCSTARLCATPDEGGTDDAGLTRCEQLLRCIVDCAEGGWDAGTPPPSYTACKNSCSPGYDSTEQLNAIAVDMCAALFCSGTCRVARN